MKMKRIIRYIILTLISISNLSPSFAQNISVPVLNSPVTDLTATLTDHEISIIEQKLLKFESDSIAQIVVLMISTTGEETIEEYSMRVADQWEIGFENMDNGIIILVAKDDRKIRIEIGYGLEHKITDSDALDIINDEITPEFKAGYFYEGINSGIDKLIYLTENEPVEPEDNVKPKHEKQITDETKELRGKKWYLTFIIVLIFAQFIPMFLTKSKLWIHISVILLLLLADYILGILNNDMEIAWIYLIITGVLSIIPLLINIFNVSGSSSGSTYSSYKSYSSGSSYSNRSSSSYSSWGSSSGSSYSGGGGSFGGGGASGSW